MVDYRHSDVYPYGDPKHVASLKEGETLTGVSIINTRFISTIVHETTAAS